jgi:hypothetical protein
MVSHPDKGENHFQAAGGRRPEVARNALVMEWVSAHLPAFPFAKSYGTSQHTLQFWDERVCNGLGAHAKRAVRSDDGVEVTSFVLD